MKFDSGKLILGLLTGKRKRVLTVGFVILVSPLSILSSVSPLSSYAFQVPKECREHCESNRPQGGDGPFTFNCGSLPDGIIPSPSTITMDCDDTTCARIQCPPEICTNGTVHCPAALERLTNSSTPSPKNSPSEGNGKARFGNDGPGGGGFQSSGIPTWFWVVFGIILFISICSVLCGFANRSYRGHGYGGYHHHYHDDGCGGGHYHDHHHGGGCGGGYYDNYGYGGGPVGYAPPPMTYVASSMTMPMPVHPAASVQHVYQPQTHLY